MNEFINLIGNSSTGSREKVTILNTDCFFQQRIDSLFVKLIFQLIHHRRSLTQTQIIQIMDSTYPDSIQHQCFLQPCCFVNFLLYTCIYFLPETGNTTHQCRTNFLNRCLNIRRTKIDTNLHSFMNTEITPCFLKHVCQGEEVHRYILIRHGRQTVIVCMKLFQITGMMKHDALRFTRCAGCIENVCQVIV